jgi:uncharacterized repeat protein (TIGR03803 family)
MKALHFSMELRFVIAVLFFASATIAGAQTMQTLCYFYGTNGTYPEAALTLGNDGNFYGTTEEGGLGYEPPLSYGGGTIFQVTTNGILTSLVSFDVNYILGFKPSGLSLGVDGNYYGTTEGGGSYGAGTFFRVTTNGTFTTLSSPFLGYDGENPNGLTLGNEGNFYGTAAYGGMYSTDPNGMGTVFQITTNGMVTPLVLFNFTNGMYPKLPAVARCAYHARTRPHHFRWR